VSELAYKAVGFIWAWLAFPVRLARVESKVDILLKFCPHCRGEKPTLWTP
jgi:hypothetical protein